jgi:hypothetical protein
MTTVMVVIDSDIGRGPNEGAVQGLACALQAHRTDGVKLTFRPGMSVASVAGTVAFRLGGIRVCQVAERELPVRQPPRCRVAITIRVRPTNPQSRNGFEALTCEFQSVPVSSQSAPSQSQTKGLLLETWKGSITVIVLLTVHF